MSQYIEKTYSHMGGSFIFRAYPKTTLQREEIEFLFDRASVEVSRIENLLTDFKSSPFNKINDFAGIRPVCVNDEIFHLIKEACEISKLTNGSFDISTASVGHLWREARKVNQLPCSHEVKKRKSLINYKLIQMNELNKSVYLPHENMKITLGGIGKGYAVDKSFEFLKSEGLENFYVNGSGDIRVHSSTSAPRPWKIGMRNPFSKTENKAMGVLLLKNQAICSSGDYINTVIKKDSSFHHIINPQMGYSNNKIKSVTVLANKTILADTLATSLMTMNEPEALHFIKKNNLNAIIVNQSGNVSISESLAKWPSL